MHTISPCAGPFGAAKGRFDAAYCRGRIVAAGVRGVEILLLWQRRASQRAAISAVSDVGLSRFEVVWESRKPFWRA